MKRYVYKSDQTGIFTHVQYVLSILRYALTMIKDVSLHVPINMMCCSPCYRRSSLRSKLSVWFRNKRGRVTGFSVLAARKK